MRIALPAYRSHKIPYPYYPGHGTFRPTRLVNIQDDSTASSDPLRDVATRLKGDFDGDGGADVGAVYSYATGAVTAFTFLADGTGGFSSPAASWSVPSGQWYTDHAQFLSGNIDGSGRDEMAAFYGYANGSATMFTFTTDTAGGFAPPSPSCTVGPGQWYEDNVDMA